MSDGCILKPPPKKDTVSKKKNTKKGSRKKQLNVVDAKHISEMTREELEAHVDRLCKELERERAERNLLQLERDRINSFWTTTKFELETRSDELRVAQETSQKTAERYEREIMAYRLKVRQIGTCHANQLAEVKAEMEVAAGLAALEASAGTSRPRLKEEVLRKEADDHNELLTNLRQDYEQQSEAERLLYLEKTRKLEERLDLQCRSELQATEERKNAFIEEMMRNHEKAFMEMKNYYDTITARSINLIDELKIQLEEKQKVENRLVKENGEHLTRNRLLENELNIYQRRAKIEIRDMKSSISNIKMDNEILHQRLKSVENERNVLYDSYESSVKVVKQNCGAKNTLLEKQIVSMSEAEIIKLISEGAMAGTFDAAAYSALMRTFKQTMENYGIKTDSVLINCEKSALGKGLIPISPG
ncbi:unnamed protein product [Rodentolepis nana]|uniref:Dynein regulatory complex subunit 4 n=1 Tax=Rodentolepis nana TaxID=102285 RepID=A0A0R3T1B0_RODNA|nr:unnamed protein product [Rodentolepis nana]